MERDIDAAWAALKDAADPCIHFFLATSPIHRKHKLKMEKERCWRPPTRRFVTPSSSSNKIEFSPEDAGRTELDFLCEVTEMAIKAGATVVNIPDTVGYMTPAEFGNIFKTSRRRFLALTASS